MRFQGAHDGIAVAAQVIREVFFEKDGVELVQGWRGRDDDADVLLQAGPGGDGDDAICGWGERGGGLDVMVFFFWVFRG